VTEESHPAINHGRAVWAGGGKTAFRDCRAPRKSYDNPALMIKAFHSTSAMKRGWGPNEEAILSISNCAKSMGSPAAAVPISPPGSFLHSFDSHSAAAQAHCASSQATLATLPSCRGMSRMSMWREWRLHIHLAAILVGCLG